MPHPFDRYSSFTNLDLLKAASNKPLRKSLRVNTLKSSVAQFKKWAGERGWKLNPVLWCPEAFFIDRNDHSVALGKDILHLLGHVYMQEAASMLPAVLLEAQPGEVILDMSAAPGSKTTQIGAMMGSPSTAASGASGGGGGRGEGVSENRGGRGEGVLVANDVQEKRLWTLKSSLHRCGVRNNIVTKKVGQWFAKNMTERFDRVLCDAPCTAQGTSRKDADALLYCSLENIGKMARLQRELLEAAVHACKVGGRIVYSTCTLTPEENEEVVVSILHKFAGQVEIVDPRTELRVSGFGFREILDRAIADSVVVQEADDSRNSQLATRNLPLLRLWPHSFDTEGFFCAVLRKVAPTRHPEKFPPVRFQEDELPPARQNNIGKICEEMYGTSFLHDGDQLFLRADTLILTNDAVADFRLPVQNYALGIPFARKIDGARIRLSHELITLRGHEATKNVLEISEADVDQLLDGKDILCPKELKGDPIIRCGDLVIGSSLAKEGKLMNRLPRWIVAKS